MVSPDRRYRPQRATPALARRAASAGSSVSDAAASETLSGRTVSPDTRDNLRMMLSASPIPKAASPSPGLIGTKGSTTSTWDPTGPAPGIALPGSAVSSNAT